LINKIHDYRCSLVSGVQAEKIIISLQLFGYNKHLKANLQTKPIIELYCQIQHDLTFAFPNISHQGIVIVKYSHQQSLFPWHENCHFELLIDGDQYFPAMLESIRQAQHYILFENYLTESSQITSQFIKAFTDARARGVIVRLLLDDFGAKGLVERDRECLLEAGIETIFYNPFSYKRFIRSLRRNHRKILIIDGHYAYAGGAGLTDEFSHEYNPHQSWHDVMVKVHGLIVHDWIAVFRHSWQQCNPGEWGLPVIPAPVPIHASAGHVAISQGPRLQEINRDFIKHIRSAEQQVWLMTPYFMAARKIRNALKQAARRGVDVRIILPGYISDHPWVSRAARGFYARLLKNKVRIFEFNHRFPHAKIEFCDQWVSIGSSNLDRWNQHWNMDANQEIDASPFADKVRELFENDFTECTEITYEQWHQRPRLHRLREWFWGRFVMLLEVFTRNYQK